MELFLRRTNEGKVVVEGRRTSPLIQGLRKTLQPCTTPTERITNFAGAVTRATKATINGEKILSPKDEVQNRLSICQSCEQFTGKTCKLCGCIIRFKARLQTEHCPINKW